MKIIQNYFPSLTSNQVNQFEALFDLYSEWNAKINVISRKDIQNLYLHHVLHSLAIAKFVNFAPHSRVLDVGTGGGFPGIPLAIFFPEQEFVMIDSIGKKIKVVNEVAQAISLTNVEATHRRVQDEKRKYDFKGGDLADELKPFKNIAESFPLTDYFSEPFFETKKLVYLPII